MNAFDFDESFDVVKNYFNTSDVVEAVKKSESINFDILCLTFNIEDTKQIKNACTRLLELQNYSSKTLMIRGSGNDDIDRLLIPELLKVSDKIEIVATVNENNYKQIVPITSKNNQIISIRTPIDINLAKEMNILVSDMGQSLDKIFIDSDIGGLGYGLDYGYSMIEKIKLEGNNDKYLNMPIISFAGEESLKTKEAKSDMMTEHYGKLKDRAEMFEIGAVSAVISAGANIVVINNPKTIEVLKGMINE